MFAIIVVVLLSVKNVAVRKCVVKRNKKCTTQCSQSLNYHIIHSPQQQYCGNGLDFDGVAGSNYINAPVANFALDNGLNCLNVLGAGFGSGVDSSLLGLRSAGIGSSYLSEPTIW